MPDNFWINICQKDGSAFKYVKNKRKNYVKYLLKIGGVC